MSAALLNDAKGLRRGEAGFSLAELLIYSLLLSLVLLIVGGMLISSLGAERTVRTVVEATSQGQLAARSIDKGIRNSLQFTLTTPAGTNQLIRARVQDSDDAGNVYCAAWYYSTVDHLIRYKRFTPASPTATGTIPAVPTTAELKTWTLLVSGVRPASGLDATAPIFSALGGTLTTNFAVLAGEKDLPPVISTSSTRRLTQENSLCY